MTAEERAFFERCYAAYRAGCPWSDFVALVWGPDNPVVRAAGGTVTRAVYVHPLFRAVRDLEDRLGDCARPSLMQPLPGGGVELTWGQPPYRLAMALGPDGALCYLLVDDRGSAAQYEDVDDVSWDDAGDRIGRFLGQ